MPRRFGPIAGAGVAVVEQDPERTIVPAPTGVTLYVGKTRRGRTTELIWSPTKGEFLAKCGDYIGGSELPNAAIDFFNNGLGRGELYVVRLTDGLEVQAQEGFFSRGLGHGFFAGPKIDAAWNTKEVKKDLVDVLADNGGRWGGQASTKTFDVATVATDITATTVISGITMLVDQYKDAILRLGGVSSRTYVVQSNTTAGVLSVQSDQDMAADLAGGGDAANATVEIDLDTEVQAFPTALAGTRRSLSIVWKDGEENETDFFGLEVYDDESKVLDYPNLSMDSGSKWYAPSVINNDLSNSFVSFSDLFSGTIDADIRPANWSGAAQGWSSDTMTVQIAHVRSITTAVTDHGWVGDWVMPSLNRVLKQRLRLTFTSPTAFGVTTLAADGADLRNLGAGVVGTAFASSSRYTIGFTVHAGINAWAIGNVIDIDVLPLPVDADGVGLLRGFVFPDLVADKRNKVRISQNTANTVTLVSAPSPVPAAHLQAAGNIDTGALVFPLTLTDLTLQLQHSFFGTEALTIAAGPHATAAALAIALNASWQAASGSAGNIAADGGANNILFTIDSSGADLQVGYESFMIVGTDANAELNLAAGARIVGALGKEFRIQARTELRGGYDGADPADSVFLAAAADPVESLVSRLEGKNKGLVKIACPGVTSTAVQKAWISLAEAFSYQYRYEIPESIVTDSAVIAYVNDTLGRNDFGKVTFPSRGTVANPTGAGTIQQTLTGMIHGVEARVAASYDGYHKVAAGVDVVLANLVKIPTADRRLNQEILVPQGINIIRRIQGQFVLWGARTVSLNPAWKFSQQRETMSHYERQLLEGFEFIIFAINDQATQDDLITTLRAFFLPEWQKRAVRGDKFEDAVSLKIDSENNTNATRSDGNLFADISLRLADTVERFVIRIGNSGIFEDLA